MLYLILSKNMTFLARKVLKIRRSTFLGTPGIHNGFRDELQIYQFHSVSLDPGVLCHPQCQKQISQLTLAFLDCFHTTAKCVFWIFNSNCAFWITQCTHDRSTCVFWITHYTHEWPKMWFSFRERGEEAWLCLGCLPIKHARVLFTFPLHVQRAVL